MANSLCGAGSYSDLTVINGISLSKEEFAVGIRQGSELVGKINEQLVALYKNGKLQELATQFGTQEGQDGCSIALCDLSAK
jgi:polar amino acid transport system substrate-binding protein